MRSRRGPSRSARRAGHALACTMIFLVLAMLLWTVNVRQMGSWLRTEKAQVVRSEHETRSAKAMAWALTLLETGVPPQNTYSCRVQIEPDQFYVLTFELEDSTHRRVTVRPAEYADLLLPLAPANFVPAGGNGHGHGNGGGNGHGHGNGGGNGHHGNGNGNGNGKGHNPK